MCKEEKKEKTLYKNLSSRNMETKQDKIRKSWYKRKKK